MLYMPGLVFIDKDGMIRAQYEGKDPFLEETSAEKNIRAELEKLMAPPPVKKSSKNRKK